MVFKKASFHECMLLQRHIQVWRTRTVLTFADDGWLDDVVEAGQSLPPPLRVSVDLGEDGEQSA